MLHYVLECNCTMFLSATALGTQSHRGGSQARPHNRPLSTSRNDTIMAFINVNIGVAQQPFWNVFATKGMAFLGSCCVCEWGHSWLNDYGNAQLRLRLFVCQRSKPAGSREESPLTNLFLQSITWRCGMWIMHKNGTGSDVLDRQVTSQHLHGSLFWLVIT